MPTPIPIVSNSTVPLQKIVNWAKTQPGLTPVLGASGYQEEPALTIANDCMGKLLAQGLDWSWNYVSMPSLLTVALQQDYLTQATDVGWIQGIDRVDINNSTNNGNLAPKPLTNMEVVRELKSTSTQANPFQGSIIPNSQANFGQWMPNTAYSCGYGVASVPASPIQQFIDAQGNFLFIDSTVLNLSINSPGFTNQPVVLPSNSPYGISGAVEPQASPNAPAGTTVTDGTVTWTVAAKNGYAVRINPLPAQSGLCWLLRPYYQKKAQPILSLQQTLYPIPNDQLYLFRSGFLAYAYDHAGSPKAPAAYAKWEEQIMTALKAGDRLADAYIMYPSDGIMGGGIGSPGVGWALGPANPYSQMGGW